MIHINVIAVGRLKEEYWRKAGDEYKKRLGGLCKIDIIELAESRLSDKPSQKEILSALEKEGGAMLEKISPKSYNIAMCIEGKMIDSVSLADKIAKISVDGISTINFLIGSSFGLSDKVKQKADFKMSMSPMTFPHQLARIMLLEQVYRAFSINANTSYHK